MKRYKQVLWMEVFSRTLMAGDYHDCGGSMKPNKCFICSPKVATRTTTTTHIKSSFTLFGLNRREKLIQNLKWDYLMRLRDL